MMSDNKFKSQWVHILDQYKAKREAAQAYLDREASRLFVESGWTQDRIAQAIGKSQSWVKCRLRYGRFLDFSTTVLKRDLPKNLTEWRFRGYWEKTTGSKEEVRFRKVHALMEDDLLLAKPAANITQQIAERYADGKWRHFDTLQAQLCDDPDDCTALQTSIRRIRSHHAAGLMVEEKLSTHGRNKYRFTEISSKAKNTSAASFIEEVRPYLEEALAHINAKIPLDAVDLTRHDLKNIKKVVDRYLK